MGHPPRSDSAFLLLKIIGLLAILFTTCDAGCAMPEELRHARWLDSSRGLTNISTWELTGWSFQVDGQLIDNWLVVDSSHYQTDGRLALRSYRTFTKNRKTFYSYLCLKFKRLFDDGRAFMYYQLHDPDLTANNERVLVYRNNNLTRFEEVCKIQQPAFPEQFGIMVKEGRALASLSTCPKALLGTFMFTSKQAEGNVSCEGVMDVCSDQKVIAVNRSSCSQPNATHHTEMGCITGVEVKRTEPVLFTQLYNARTNNSNGAMHFACLVSSLYNKEATLVPGACTAGQSPFVFPRDEAGKKFGVEYVSIASETCPNDSVTSDSTPTASSHWRVLFCNLTLLLLMFR